MGPEKAKALYGRIETNREISNCRRLNPTTPIKPWKAINVQRPPTKIHFLNENELSGPQKNITECPIEFAGVLTATVKKLQPSKYELAKTCVYQEVTKVVPVNQPPKLK